MQVDHILQMLAAHERQQRLFIIWYYVFGKGVFWRRKWRQSFLLQQLEHFSLRWLLAAVVAVSEPEHCCWSLGLGLFWHCNGFVETKEAAPLSGGHKSPIPYSCSDTSDCGNLFQFHYRRMLQDASGCFIMEKRCTGSGNAQYLEWTHVGAARRVVIVCSWCVREASWIGLDWEMLISPSWIALNTATHLVYWSFIYTKETVFYNLLTSKIKKSKYRASLTPSYICL